ncbi:hypothetical protein COW95_02690 [Candidatus Peregrinibacteria bacterium CG22_combo_CG10-13_8_21_14_all_49_11]|nr:MAG: hypothetical protein COW95_02690 [Candidatus Peregrinibacteria bacterium CG22_combo_CG10-13_8_21_14_all_49_11]
MKRSVLCSLVAMALTACQPASLSTDDPIKIGYIGPLTGEAAPYGKDTFNGTKLAVDQINANGGIHGRMIELVTEDGRCNGTDAASAARKLTDIDHVVAIIGGQCSGETLAAAPIAESAETVMISPLSSSPDVTDAGDFIFRDYPSDALKTAAMAKFFAEEGYEKVALITENTDFASAFRNALKEKVGEEKIVFDEVVEPGTKDFRTLVTRLKDTEFDIFFPNAQTDAVMAAMMEQLREQGLIQQAITHDVGDSPTLVELAGDAVDGTLVINVPSAGEGGVFQRQFEEAGYEPQASIAFAAHAFDAVNVLAKAIESAGTDSTAIRDYLYDIKSYKGIVGNFSFDQNGDVVGIPYVLKQFKNGEIVKVKDISVN